MAFQHRDFLSMWLGQLISQAGSQMQFVAISWHIYLLTKSAVALGLIGLTRAFPIVLFSLIGGVFADARDRRRMLIVTQCTMLIFAATLGFLTDVEVISSALIYLLSALTATSMAFDGPAWQALVTNLVPKEHLTNALSLNSIMRQVATIVGPSLAGFVIAWKGVGAVYWINAVSFLAVIAALIFLKTPTQKNLGASTVSLSALKEGIRFVRRSKILLSTTLLDFFGTFFSSASALLPIFAQEILQVGPKGLGILYSAQSAGAVVAGTGMSFAGNIGRKGIWVLVAIGIYGAATAVFGMSRWFAVSVILLAVLGAADTVSMVLRHTIRQVSTPDHLRGRITSIVIIFSQGGPQLGNLEAGVVASLLGAPLSVVTGGIATVITVGIVMWLMPQLRHYED